LKIAFSRLLKPNSAPTIRFIQWHPPLYGWRKVNVDGSSSGDSGKAGCGRCGDIFRDFQVTVIMVSILLFALPLTWRRYYGLFGMVLMFL